MLGFYSLVVVVKDELPLPDQRLILFEGVNVFNVMLSDADAFCAWLTEHGCEVRQVNRLSEPDSPTPVLTGSREPSPV